MDTNYKGWKGSKRKFLVTTRVSRGNWLGKLANIKVENNGAIVYVGSSMTQNNINCD